MMILGNVERTIRPCMDSLVASGCFDQYIIVQDSRTRDTTPHILKLYRERHPQIKLLWHDWKNQDYSDARNLGLQHASTDRLYWQDGDEILMDPAGIYSLLQNPANIAYHIWQVSPTPYGKTVETHQLRLFPNLTGVKWELPVHEQVVFSLRELGVPEIITPYHVWHYGYTDDRTNTQKHIERAKIMQGWLRTHPKKDERRAYLQEQLASSMAYLQSLPRRRRIS